MSTSNSVCREDGRRRFLLLAKALKSAADFSRFPENFIYEKRPFPAFSRCAEAENGRF